MDRTSHADDQDGPRKKPRKQRPCFSCEECRRLKMKCDRQVPCSNCVRRQQADSCHAIGQNGDQSRSITAQSKSTSRPTSSSRTATSKAVPQDASTDANALDGVQTVPQDAGAPMLVQPLTDRDSTLHLLSATASNHVFRSPQALLAGTAIETHDLSTEPIPNEENAPDGSHGTLLLDKEGRARYLGPTAGSEWLKDSETQEVSESTDVTRAPSPEIAHVPSVNASGHLSSDATPVAFPFSVTPARVSTKSLLARLPPKDEAWTLVEAYYKYCAWHHDVAPKERFVKRLSASMLLQADLRHLQGYNIEMAFGDESAEDWLQLAELALVKGNFMSSNVISGIQTLHLMAHMHLELDKSRQGDCAFPLWGLVMRLVQAMGMHRDGTHWNLDPEVVEERRKVFWECNAADVFQAHCFSRPCAINPDHCDTAFPAEPLNLHGEKSYFRLRFELSQLSSQILNMTMKVRRPAYAEVIALDGKLRDFENNIPYSLRCRAALLSMPSQYPQPDAALNASPEPSKRSIAISFQQTNLSLNICETIINLHRPYYARALYDEQSDRVMSLHGPSFLTVIERCATIIALVGDIHARFPTIATRQWNLWYHVFGSALCLGTLLLHDPGNPMSSFVLAQIDAAIQLFITLIQQGATTPRYQRNLQWLVKLRTRAVSKTTPLTNPRPEQSNAHGMPIAVDESRDPGEDVELLGWRTRLIERAGKGRQTSKTIAAPATPTGSHITVGSNPPFDPLYHGSTQDQILMAEMLTSNASLPSTGGDPTDGLVSETDFLAERELMHIAARLLESNNAARHFWDDSRARQFRVPMNKRLIAKSQTS